MSLIDPIRFHKLCWPDQHMYDKQKEIVYSVRDNEETIVVAGNALGKDWITARTVLWFMCSRRPARVVTSSVQFDQLNDVLWGEIREAVQTSQYELPLHYNHMKIRQMRKDGSLVPKSELVGQTPSQDEGILGRHLPKIDTKLDRWGLPAPTTLFAVDEGSGYDDGIYEKTDTWAHRRLVIGNAFPCENFFRRKVEAGDVPDERHPGRFITKVIKITAEDSPNIRYARAELAAGKEPSNKIIVPGVKDWHTYQTNLQTYDARDIAIKLNAEFYEGAEIKMFPPEWIESCHRLLGV